MNRVAGTADRPPRYCTGLESTFHTSNTPHTHTHTYMVQGAAVLVARCRSQCQCGCGMAGDAGHRAAVALLSPTVCAAPTKKRSYEVCPMWNTRGGCKAGRRCPMVHDSDRTRLERVAQKRHEWVVEALKHFFASHERPMPFVNKQPRVLRIDGEVILGFYLQHMQPRADDVCAGVKREGHVHVCGRDLSVSTRQWSLIMVHARHLCRACIAGLARRRARSDTPPQSQQTR